MAYLQLIKQSNIIYVQIQKLPNNCFYSKIDQMPQYIQAIAFLYLYKNTVLLLDRYIKTGIGIYFN